MKELVEVIAKALVDNPDEVVVTETVKEKAIVLEKSGNFKFSSIFQDFGCSFRSIPCVDGLRYVGDSNYGYKSECYVYDNRSVECFFPLRHALNMGNSKYPNGYIAWKYVCTNSSATWEIKSVEIGGSYTRPVVKVIAKNDKYSNDFSTDY